MAGSEAVFALRLIRHFCSPRISRDWLFKARQASRGIGATRRGSNFNLVFKGDALGFVLLEPPFGCGLACEYLEMPDVADVLAHIDVIGSSKRPPGPGHNATSVSRVRPGCRLVARGVLICE